jgi:hypothetical protein
MNDLFTTRVRAAAVAGWWTVLIGVAFLWFLSAVYLIETPNPSAWILRLAGVGNGMSWSDVQHIFLWFIVGFKFFLYMLVVAVIWLTLWGRQLKKRTNVG